MNNYYLASFQESLLNQIGNMLCIILMGFLAYSSGFDNGSKVSNCIKNNDKLIGTELIKDANTKTVSSTRKNHK